MQPNLFKLEDKGKHISLYVCQLSTYDALKIFDPTASIMMTKFGALSSHKASQVWLSQQEIPSWATVENVTSFLSQNEWLQLIDFSATIGGQTHLSTHDDGEAHFLFSDTTRAMQALETFTKHHQSPNFVETIIRNPGKYVALEKDAIEIFPTFDAYLKTL